MWALPAHVDLRAVPLEVDQVDGTIAYDLVCECDLAAPGETGLQTVHGAYGRRRSVASQVCFQVGPPNAEPTPGTTARLCRNSHEPSLLRPATVPVRALKGSALGPCVARPHSPAPFHSVAIMNSVPGCDDLPIGAHGEERGPPARSPTSSRTRRPVTTERTGSSSPQRFVRAPACTGGQTARESGEVA